MMKPCMKCRHFSMVRLETVCRKTGKTVSPLLEQPCFEEMAQITEINPQNTTAMSETPKTKVCKSCGQELPVEQFGRHAKSRDGFQSVCMTCASQARKGRRPVRKAPLKSEEICPPPLTLRQRRISGISLIERSLRNSASVATRALCLKP